MKGPHEGPARRRSPCRYATVLALVFALEWLVLAIGPRYRADWALENALSVAFVVALALSYRRLVLSRISCTAIFLFLSVHTIGAHYTYSEVPYDAWARALTGHALNDLLGWQRNHFDRFAHFAYGFLLAYPIRELLIRVVGVRGFWGYYLPLAVMMSTSAEYELAEWGAAALFGGELGIAYLGAQGDAWDAQKDMALAGLGALLAMTLLAVVNAWLRRDCAREWVERLAAERTPATGGSVLAPRPRSR
jgi:putative membrane protein